MLLIMKDVYGNELWNEIQTLYELMKKYLLLLRLGNAHLTTTVEIYHFCFNKIGLI